MATKPANSASLHSYAAALRRIAALKARDRTGVNPIAGTWLGTHGDRVGRAIVLYHGYTSSPPQFRQLGERLYSLGYNVLIPRAPHHGLADRLTPDQARLTAEELMSLVDETVAIARGLGHQVTVAGLSMGGVMAGYAAQVHEVDRAILVAPAFGYHPLPQPLARPASFLAVRLPNRFIWRDAELKDATGPEYDYPRYSTRALAQILRLTFFVQARARRQQPAAHAIVVVTNANDRDASNAAAARVTGLWRRRVPQRVEAYEFPESLGLPHNIIDPAELGEEVAVVHPVLLDLITGR